MHAGEWGPTPPAGWGPDTAVDTLEILTGLTIKQGGQVGKWEVYTTGGGKVAMGIWEKVGVDFQLKCVDMLDIKAPGFHVESGSCSFSAGDYIGIGQAGPGRVVMNQDLPGEGAGIVQFSAVKNPGAQVGQKTPPFATGNSDCCHNRQYAVKIVCTNGWGWAFLLFLMLGSSAYVGGSILYSHKVQGQPLTPLQLPHREFWMEVKSLVEDGVSLTKAYVEQRTGQRGDYAPVPESEKPLPGTDDESPSTTPTKATPAPKGAVVEERDESVHPSKAKIKVVLSELSPTTEENASDDEELVE